MLDMLPRTTAALDALAVRYKTALAKTQAGRLQWIEGSLELIVVIAEARRYLPDHREYNQWLERNNLRVIGKTELSALNQMSHDLDYTRNLLEQSYSISYQEIWRHRPDKPQNRTLPGSRKGPIPAPGRKHLMSGAQKRKRALVIPDVMRDDYDQSLKLVPTEPKPPPLERKAVEIKGLTREQVDPDFKGTPLEFRTKYGHVNLQTKDQIEHHKQQEALMAWLGTVTNLAKAGTAMLAALPAADPEVIQAWLQKPGKTDKMRGWCQSVRVALEKLEPLCRREP